MRRPQPRSVIGAMLTLALSLSVLAGPSAADETEPPPTAPPPASIDEDLPAAQPSVDEGVLAPLQAQAATDGEVRVIVQMADGGDPSPSVDAALAGTDHTVGASGDDFVGVQVDSEGLDRLAATPGIGSIVEDVVLRPTASSSLAADVHADVLHDRGIRGDGRRIALLDSGIDLGHPTFAGFSGDVFEACIVTHGSEPCDVEGAGTAAPCSPSIAGCEHGTHVASLAVGSGAAAVPGGIAPDVDLIAIRVLSPDGGAVVALSSDVALAIDRILALDAVQPVDAVNMSLGSDFAFPGDGTCNTSDGGLLQAKFAALRAADIAPVVAAGNQGAAGLSYPACVSGAIAVTGSDTATNGLWTGANRNANVAIAAPAADLLGAIPPGSVGPATKSGTSLAAPQVSGAIALMRQVEPGLSVSAIPGRLSTTGRPLVGTAIRQLDVAAAIGGYWVVRTDGSVSTAGLAAPKPRHGPAPPPGESVVAGSPTRTGQGYWIATDRGRVVAHGDATHFGDASSIHLNKPVVAMAATPTGKGYWLLAQDGGIFTYGDARFYGSTGNMTLNAPVTDIATSHDGGGYWLTAKDGGVFTFGNAAFYGSTGNMTLNQPVVSMASTPSGHGYWLVALDGGVFTFGDAAFHGSLPGRGVATISGNRVRATGDGRGYYISTLDGGVHAFGAATPIAPAGLPPTGAVDLMLVGFH